MPSAGDVAKQSASSAISSKLGGFGLGGFGKKKADPPSPDPAPVAGQPQTSSVLMETNTQLGNFSRTVNEASFAIPAGFKLVQTKVEN